MPGIDAIGIEKSHGPRRLLAGVDLRAAAEGRRFAKR
jgi:hypothetical protein